MTNYILIQQYPSGRQDILISFKNKIDAEKQKTMLQKIFSGYKSFDIPLVIKEIEVI